MTYLLNLECVSLPLNRTTMYDMKTSNPKQLSAEFASISTDIHLLFDLESFQLVYLNDNGKELLSQLADIDINDQYLVKHFNQYIHPDDLNNIFSLQYEPGDEGSLEIRLQNSKTTYTKLQCRYLVKKEEQKLMLYVAGQIPSQSHQTFLTDLIYENIQEGIMLFDHSARLLWCNKAALAMHKVRDISEFSSLKENDQIPLHLYDENFKKINQSDYPLNRVMNGETMYNRSYTYKNKENEDFKYCMVSAWPVFDLNQSVNGCLLSINDITEFRRLQLQLQEMAIRYQTIIETIDVGLFLINPQGKILEANQFGLRMNGYDSLDEWNDEVAKYKSRLELEDLQGNPVPYEDWPSVRSLRGEHVIDYEGVMHRLDNGEKTYVSVNSKPIHSTDGKIISIVHSIRDISKLKEQELAKEQLLKEAKAGQELLENLLYIAAHDLKGPLGNAGMIYNLIQNAKDQAEKDAYLLQLENVLKRLTKTLNGLTEILELQNFDQKNIKLIYFGQVLHDLKETFSELLTDNDELIADFSGATSIHYVEVFVFSLLKNLIHNAIKYKKQDQPLRLTLHTRREAEFVVLTIQDNGIGIDLSKYSNQMFTPFKRFTQQNTGTGVGLYLVKSIINRNGGDIKVESTPGEGTTFHCYLKEYKVSG